MNTWQNIEDVCGNTPYDEGPFTINSGDEPIYQSFTVEVPSRPEPKPATPGGFVERGSFYRNDGHKHLKSYGTLC